MTSYHIWTVGCQMNEADSERLASALDQIGCKPTPDINAADVIVLNSCVVRQGVEDKVTGRLDSLKPVRKANPDATIALMGCMVGPKTGALAERFPISGPVYAAPGIRPPPGPGRPAGWAVPGQRRSPGALPT